MIESAFILSLFTVGNEEKEKLLECVVIFIHNQVKALNCNPFPSLTIFAAFSVTSSDRNDHSLSLVPHLH